MGIDDESNHLACVQKLQTASHASFMRRASFPEPDAGNLPVRFDEREQETGPGQTGLRGTRRKPSQNIHRETTVTAPVLDSTQLHQLPLKDQDQARLRLSFRSCQNLDLIQ